MSKSNDFLAARDQIDIDQLTRIRDQSVKVAHMAWRAELPARYRLYTDLTLALEAVITDHNTAPWK